MKRPILFKGEMVRAILSGRKTQTRRVLIPPTHIDSNHFDVFSACTYPNSTFVHWPFDDAIEERITRCPYGQPGDLLWVREIHRLASINARTDLQFWTIQFKEGFDVLPHPQPKRELFEPLANRDKFAASNTGIDFGKWRPSIHMYQWMSRITLRITSVRVERVQDISDDDAVAEGVEDLCHCGDYVRDHGYLSGHAAVSMPGWAKENFSSLWDSINAKRGYSWESNPWVWVIEFERV